MRPKVLMACIHPFTSIFQVGSQHIARQFIKNGYDVAYISSPISPFHIIKKPNKELLNRFNIYKKGGEFFFNNRLWQYVPFSLFTSTNKPFLKTKYVLKNWKNVCIPKLSKKIASNGFAEVDIAYFDNLLSFPLLKDIKYRHSIFRIMDNHLGFPNYPNVLSFIEDEIRNSVDVVVYSAKALKPYANRFAGNTSIYMPNGIDINSFRDGTRDLPFELKKIKKPIAVYVGALEKWFDYDLVAFAAKKLPDINFLIIGPIQGNCQKLKKYSNIFMIGTVAHNNLQRYLFNCSVGIIPFNVNRYKSLIDSVNPLKLYEYMACGLPVVATEWKELKSLKSPAISCNTEEKFVQALKEVTLNPIDQDMFIEFAKQHSWDNSFNKLINQISSM